MFKKNNWSPNTTLVLGVFLLISGIIGFLIIPNSQIKVTEKGRYRYLERRILVIPTPKSIISPTPKAQVTATTSEGIFLNNRFSIIPGLTYIHILHNQDLENPKIPDRIEIPAINLIAPVIVSDYNTTKIEGETFGQWVAPSKYAAGWHPDSALLGELGNTVINGHHNEFGEVFGGLVDIKVGDLIYIYFKDEVFTFIASNRMILNERFQTAEVRMENARWISQTDDIRLTLVTCWPDESNTHRLLIVARPFKN